MFFHWLSVWITCSMAISAILHLSVHSTVPSNSIRSSTFPESLTLLSNERLVVWTNARRTTLQLSLARPAECACAWRVSVRLLSCSSASSLRDHSVQRKQILFGPLFFSAFGILGASSVMVSYSFTSIQFEPHGEQAEIVIKETKESTVLFFQFFSYIFTFLFPFFIKESVNCVCLKAIGILPAWQLPRGWSAEASFPGFVPLLLTRFVILHCYLHPPIKVVLLNGNERAG